MDLSDLQTLIGDLCNDPNHERYTTTQLNGVLNNCQNEWNLEAAILKDTVTVTVVDGTNSYALSNLTGTPVRFDRVTHQGIDLNRRDKSWFDLYASDDWSDDIGTPKQYYVDVSDPDNQKIFLYPIPQAGDAGANLIVEYVKMPNNLSSSTDVPFNSNTLLLPYHHGLAYRTAAMLLQRDPTQENLIRVTGYLRTSNIILSKVIEIFKAQEREEPMRLRGGRYWASGV